MEVCRRPGGGRLYQNDQAVGEGVRWNQLDKNNVWDENNEWRAWKLVDGRKGDEISLDEARTIAQGEEPLGQLSKESHEVPKREGYSSENIRREGALRLFGRSQIHTCVGGLSPYQNARTFEPTNSIYSVPPLSIANFPAFHLKLDAVVVEVVGVVGSSSPTSCRSAACRRCFSRRTS